MKSNLIKLSVITFLLLIAPYSYGDYHRNGVNGVNGPNNHNQAKRGAALNKNQNKNQAQNAATATAVHNDNVNTQATEQNATQAEITQMQNQANTARSTIKSIIENKATQNSQ